MITTCPLWLFRAPPLGLIAPACFYLLNNPARAEGDDRGVTPTKLRGPVPRLSCRLMDSEAANVRPWNGPLALHRVRVSRPPGAKPRAPSVTALHTTTRTTTEKGDDDESTTRSLCSGILFASPVFKLPPFIYPFLRLSSSLSDSPSPAHLSAPPPSFPRVLWRAQGSKGAGH